MFKQNLNTLNKIKNEEIVKHKRRTTKHKELLNLFNDLWNIILIDKTLKSESQEDKHKNENEKVESRKEENEKVESIKVEKKKMKMKMMIMILKMKMKMKMIIKMKMMMKQWIKTKKTK